MYEMPLPALQLRCFGSGLDLPAGPSEASAQMRQTGLRFKVWDLGVKGLGFIGFKV